MSNFEEAQGSFKIIGIIVEYQKLFYGGKDLKKTILIPLLIVLILCVSACGNSQTAKNDTKGSEAENINIFETPEQDWETEEENVEKPLVEIDGNIITIKDENNGEKSEENGMKKTPLLTNKNIKFTSSAGPIDYSITGIQISKLEINESTDATNFLGLEKGEEYTLIAIGLIVENTSEDDVSFYPDQSTIVTSAKEQVSSEIFINDDVGGEFLGQVRKEGQIFFFCKNSSAEDVSSIVWRCDPPYDDEFNHFGDDIKIEIHFEK